MKPCKANIGCIKSVANTGKCKILTHRKAKFRIFATSANIFMGVRLTPGVMRIKISCVTPISCAIADTRESSMRESTTIRPTPASIASRSSCGVLLLPCTITRSIGKSTARATANSPPPDTSRHMPCLFAKRQTALLRNALLAYAMSEFG